MAEELLPGRGLYGCPPRLCECGCRRLFLGGTNIIAGQALGAERIIYNVLMYSYLVTINYSYS